jgi:hypothetical protein
VVSNELNRILDINLIQLQTIKFLNGETSKEFNAYNYFSEENNFMFSILSNHGTEGALIENYRTLDYFLIISGENQPIADNQTIKKIKESQLFLAASYLSIKSQKENRIFQEIVNQLWE